MEYIISMNIEWEPLRTCELEKLHLLSSDLSLETYESKFTVENSNKEGILSLGTSNCPQSSVIIGSSKPITFSTVNGTPPYSVNWKVDGQTKNSWNNLPEGYTQSFNWTFNESIGYHTYLVEVIDSCPSGSLTNSSSCVINIVSGTPPPTTPPSTTPPITTPPPSSIGCADCDLINNICLIDQCLSKKYLLYGGVGFIFLMILTRR